MCDVVDKKLFLDKGTHKLMFFIIMVKEGCAFIKPFFRLVGDLGPVYMEVGDPR